MKNKAECATTSIRSHRGLLFVYEFYTNNNPHSTARMRTIKHEYGWSWYAKLMQWVWNTFTVSSGWPTTTLDTPAARKERKTNIKGKLMHRSPEEGWKKKTKINVAVRKRLLFLHGETWLQKLFHVSLTPFCSFCRKQQHAKIKPKTAQQLTDKVVDFSFTVSGMNKYGFELQTVLHQ